MKIENTGTSHVNAATQVEGYARTNYLGRGAKVLALSGMIGAVALSNLPCAEATVVPGTFGHPPVCLAACVTLITVTTGGWGVFAAWMACKSACIAAALAF